jgi:hypothetical protein
MTSEGGGGGKLPPVDHDPLNEGAVGKITWKPGYNKYRWKVLFGQNGVQMFLSPHLFSVF